ncbi:MAG: SGNH/GDSL hydrolase family protein [Sphingomonas sp.]
MPACRPLARIARSWPDGCRTRNRRRGSMIYPHKLLWLLAALTAIPSIADPGGGESLAGADYVAMGSSFAAGPGVTRSADQPPNRCARSEDNYAHLLARRMNLRLADVSCSAATTGHLLGPWNELPAQIDAVTADTRLVTITVGGNDVGYIGALMSASCRTFATPPPGTPGGKCPVVSVPADAWAKLEAALRMIVVEIRRRSPRAWIIFVDYLTVLPERGLCAATPLTAEDADAGRATAKRLAALTARVAGETGSDVIAMSALSRHHDAFSAEPWMTGFPLPGGARFVPYHPNAQGMAAVADALARRLDTPS